MTPMGDSGQRATSSVRVLAFRVSRLLRTRHTGRCWTTMLGRGECRAPHARVANQFGRTRYSASAALRSKRPAPSPAEPTRNGGNWRIPMSALCRQCAVKRFRNWFRPKPRVFSWFSPKENHSSRSLSGHSNCETALCAIAVAVLLLAGCSQSTTPSTSDASKAAAVPKGPPEPVTAKTAFWPMYTSARHWTTDLVILGLTPKDVPGFTNEDGKAAMWEATFASPSLHQYRAYSYAIAAVPP